MGRPATEMLHTEAVAHADSTHFVCHSDLTSDVDTHDAVQPLAQAYGVTAMPTFVVVLGGEKVDSLVGASKDKLEAMLVKHLRHQ